VIRGMNSDPSIIAVDDDDDVDDALLSSFFSVLSLHLLLFLPISSSDASPTAATELTTQK